MEQKKSKIRESLFWLERWRHGMAWQYAAVCLFDFLLAPLLIILLRAFDVSNFADAQAWVPMTLRESGLYHLAMGAILGVSAWMRGRGDRVDQITTSSQEPVSKEPVSKE